MRLIIRVPNTFPITRISSYVFFVFCFIPFLFPNPIVTTNIQPYAAVFGTVVLLLNGSSIFKNKSNRNLFLISSFTFICALLIMMIQGITIDVLRAIYNYYALLIIPCAIVAGLSVVNKYPEALFKTMIIIWFLVATIQFFVYRGFLTELISGVRWSVGYRGVVGLASEPSFLGIACFFFLHIIRTFETKQPLYTVIVLIMGVVYAQSATGMMFIAGYFAIYLLDDVNSKRGLQLWAMCIVAIFVTVWLFNTKFADSRLSQMMTVFLNEGSNGLLVDDSVAARFSAITEAIAEVCENMFLPEGYGARIGSGYGGLLVELGVFAIPAMIMISLLFSKTFSKKRSRIAYFLVVTLLLFNNTQMGNPLMLMVLGINQFISMEPKHASILIGDANENNSKI